MPATFASRALGFAYRGVQVCHATDWHVRPAAGSKLPDGQVRASQAAQILPFPAMYVIFLPHC